MSAWGRAGMQVWPGQQVRTVRLTKWPLLRCFQARAPVAEQSRAEQSTQPVPHQAVSGRGGGGKGGGRTPDTAAPSGPAQRLHYPLPAPPPPCALPPCRYEPMPLPQGDLVFGTPPLPHRPGDPPPRKPFR